MHERPAAPVSAPIGVPVLAPVRQTRVKPLHLSSVEEVGPGPWQHPGAPGCQWESAPEGRGIKEAIVLQR